MRKLAPSLLTAPWRKEVLILAGDVETNPGPYTDYGKNSCGTNLGPIGVYGKWYYSKTSEQRTHWG